MLDLQKLTQEVAHIAHEGGDFIRHSRAHFDVQRVETKHTHDFVSYVDRESEKLLVARLHALLPEAGFVTEEGTAGTDEKPCKLKWVIDPLDGTTNFLRDYAPYCVSIALVDDKEFLIGVVYEVCRDETYTAFKDGPALLNDQAIHVSSVSNSDNAYLTLELPYNVEDYKPTGAKMYEALYGKVVCVRMSGSAAASLCYVAAGRMDIWFESYICRWDYSAAALIIRQAEGQITTFQGNENILTTNNILATNGKLHPYMLNLLKEALPPKLID